MFPVLPYELNQTIIDYFYHDKSSLLRICLVCRQAVPLARRHLFYRLHGRFKREKPAEPGELRIATEGSDIEEESLSRLHLVVRGTLKVGEFVRSLSLENPSYTWFKDSATLLQRVFPSLREVRISNASWNIVPYHQSTAYYYRSKMTAGSRLKGVRSVVMIGFIWCDVEQIERFMFMFPDCDALTLKRSVVGSQQVTLVHGLKIPSLRTLFLEETDTAIVLKWIHLKSNPLRLTTLTVRKLGLQESIILGEILKSAGGSLYYLDMGFKVDGETMRYAAKVDLSRNTELRTLVFDDWSLSAWVPREWSLTILRTIRSKRFATLCFKYRVGNPVLLPLSETAAFLNNLPFPEIKTVQFINRQPYCDVERERSELINRLPGLMVNDVFQHFAEPEHLETGFFYDRYYLDK
ncbi:hypothetical protein FRC17_010406 [Serendipita sp. 399]|nr:hypothetical protein FRC17_010406 [Serendipita sp. 399]